MKFRSRENICAKVDGRYITFNAGMEIESDRDLSKEFHFLERIGSDVPPVASREVTEVATKRIVRIKK